MLYNVLVRFLMPVTFVMAALIGCTPAFAGPQPERNVRSAFFDPGRPVVYAVSDELSALRLSNGRKIWAVDGIEEVLFAHRKRLAVIDQRESGFGLAVLSTKNGKVIKRSTGVIPRGMLYPEPEPCSGMQATRFQVLRRFIHENQVYLIQETTQCPPRPRRGVRVDRDDLPSCNTSQSGMSVNLATLELQETAKAPTVQTPASCGGAHFCNLLGIDNEVRIRTEQGRNEVSLVSQGKKKRVLSSSKAQVKGAFSDDGRHVFVGQLHKPGWQWRVHDAKTGKTKSKRISAPSNDTTPWSLRNGTLIWVRLGRGYQFTSLRGQVRWSLGIQPKVAPQRPCPNVP